MEEKKYSKEIKYFGKKVTVSCDGKCNLSEGDKGTIEFDAGYQEDNYKHFPTKWCVRQCDRCNFEGD